MNIGKSIKVGLAKREKPQLWLAEELGVSPQMVSGYANRKVVGGKGIEKFAKAFGVSSSEFISWGE